MRAPVRSQSAPMPLGPCSLCPANAIESAPSCVTSSATLPSACAASTWICTRALLARIACVVAAIGCTTPISFCTMISATTASSFAAAATSSGSRTPSRPGAMRMTSRPSAASRSASVEIAGCSIVEITMRPVCVRAAPRTASALLSLQPEFQMTSPIPRSPIAARRRPRAASMWPRAAAPCG